MKKRLLLIILLLGTSVGGLQAQQKFSFPGEVRDSLGIPLEFANVMAMDTVKNTIASFGVTDKQGQFKLSLVEGQVYRLKVSFIGYLPFERVFTAKDNGGTPILITLSNDVQQLDDVEVVTEMPVLIQGDTITYKVDVFTQGNERKLGEVLEDLPGFEVDEDGGVKVQGKRVDKLLVDGKEFFEGDTKLATKNLPANVIDKVDVLQNFNDIGPLGNVNNSQQLALNIQLKEDKKNMVFGDLTAGGGPEGRYRGHANVFYYSPKTNINFIGDANNVGELAFSMSDYFRFSGGFGSFARRAGSSFQVTSDQLGIPMAQRNNARELNNQLGALNYNFTPNGKLSFSGFAIGAKVDNTLGSVQQRTYVLQPGDNQETLSSIQQVESTSGLFKFGAKYTPNVNLHIDYSAFGRIADIQNRDSQNSAFTNFSNDISGLTTQHPRSLEQQLRAFYAPDEKNVFSFEGGYKYQEQDPTYNLQTTQQPFAGIIPLQAVGAPFNLLQLKEVITHKQEAALNYYRILNKTNHINFKVGNTYTSQELTSGILERLNNSDTAIGDPRFSNLVDYAFEDYYVGVLYKTKLGDLTLSPALNLHHYRFQNTQDGTTTAFDKTLLLPSVNARYRFRSSHSLRLNYGVNAEFTDVQNIANGILVRGYNSLFGGNPMLQNSLYHKLDLSYFNFNMYNFLNVHGGLTYQRRFDDITNIIQFNGLERVNNPINIDPVNETLTGYGNISKRFDNYRIGGQVTVSRAVRNNQISDIANEEVSLTQVYKANISTTLWKALNLDLSYELTLNSYEGRNVNNKFENHRPKIELDVDFLKGFTFDFNYEYNSYLNRSNDVESTYDLMGAELRYRKEKSKWEFRIEGMNLLNTTGIRRDSFSNSLISTFEYFIQKRYWLASIMYDL